MKAELAIVAFTVNRPVISLDQRRHRHVFGDALAEQLEHRRCNLQQMAIGASRFDAGPDSM